MTQAIAMLIYVPDVLLILEFEERDKACFLCAHLGKKKKHVVVINLNAREFQFAKHVSHRRGLPFPKKYERMADEMKWRKWLEFLIMPFEAATMTIVRCRWFLYRVCVISTMGSFYVPAVSDGLFPWHN